MIIDLPNTTTNVIANRLVAIREEGGAVALGRVLTLIIVTSAATAEEAINAANISSMEHPCRVVVIANDPARQEEELDGQIRVGADAGASEVVVLYTGPTMFAHRDTLVTPLMLPDAPIVAWWPDSIPQSPATDMIGVLAQRRITDSHAVAQPWQALLSLQASYQDGDCDLAWTRLTKWRALLAAALDQRPHQPVERAVVTGRGDHPSCSLLAGWLALRLNCPVHFERLDTVEAVTQVQLDRADGPVILDRPDGSATAVLSRPGEVDHRVSLPMRQLPECLSEELRRLDPDEAYGSVITAGLDRIDR